MSSDQPAPAGPARDAEPAGPAEPAGLDEPAGPDVLAAELRVSLMKIARRLRAEKSDSELSDTQYSVLGVLDRLGPSTPRALAIFERVQPPSLTRTLAALTERGLIQRTADPADGRQAIVGLTEAGTTAVRETRHRRNVWLAAHLSQLSDGELAVLASASQILRRIAAS